MFADDTAGEGLIIGFERICAGATGDDYSMPRSLKTSLAMRMPPQPAGTPQ